MGRTVPRKRHAHLQFTSRAVGVPAEVGSAPRSEPVVPRQAQTVDPEVPRQVAQLLLMLETDPKKHTAWAHLQEAAVSFLLEWSSELRFAHLQRSVVLRASGETVGCWCLRGKNSLGYPGASVQSSGGTS